eukprot:CAMPEP_0177550814 /NCGR_PEP_ID=MMETSP0369-20130122/65794_1 /TAXON_ID=447022 ORGANISM="Scrippsiella hangoei-like, Strain SHHI-4" /NCGR_SAMPLE_ID=MMETSP0369 /ASSEMBLY_ACC=CAM_ASM_000364 /LENGTH=58 /DNA_ID=CAMNT_0019036083 /DNA_START=1 /DNA_END=174 /DNA_ORIENTATION=+
MLVGLAALEVATPLHFAHVDKFAKIEGTAALGLCQSVARVLSNSGLHVTCAPQRHARK